MAVPAADLAVSQAITPGNRHLVGFPSALPHAAPHPEVQLFATGNVKMAVGTPFTLALAARPRPCLFDDLLRKRHLPPPAMSPLSAIYKRLRRHIPDSRSILFER